MSSLVSGLFPFACAISQHSCSTPEDAETLPCIVTVPTTIPQTVKDHSLAFVNKGDLIDHLTSRRTLHVLGIATYRGA